MHDETQGQNKYIDDMVSFQILYHLKHEIWALSKPNTGIYGSDGSLNKYIKHRSMMTPNLHRCTKPDL